MAYNPLDVQQISLFEGLDAEERLWLFEISTRLQLEPNVAVVQEGESRRDLFVILNGSVRVTKGIRGELEHLATLVTGDFFGEMALLEKSTRSATVTTMEPTTLLEFKMEALEKLFMKYPKIAHKVYQNLARGLSRRLRSFGERVKEISWRED